MIIGVVTFWESTDNYGQVLQAYALQNILKQYGHEPYQIKYSLRASGAIVYKQSLLKRVIKVLAVYPLLKKIKKKKDQKVEENSRTLIEQKNIVRKFNDFREQYISQSNRLYNSIDELRLDPPKADCYITGSDQVWTMLLSNEANNAYFLDFGSDDIKRISYAASFGRSQYPLELVPKLKSLLSRFDAISVREKEGVDICKNIGLDAKHVIDPTLLLQKTDYLNLGNSELFTGVYVYSINIKTPEELYWNEVVKYAEDKSFSIKVTTSSGNFPGREVFVGADYLYATIPVWINYINDANLVVTTSFHGVVFCLIMHTNFVYVPLRASGSRGNGRVESLLSSIGISNKICYQEKDFNKIVNEIINWDSVDLKIEELRSYSKEFLLNSLK